MINSQQAFTEIDERMWRFKVGGYQVLDKYLMQRMDRALTADEVKMLLAAADSIRETLELQDELADLQLILA